MLKAGAILYAIFISVVVGITGAFVCILFQYLSASDSELERLQRISNSVCFLASYFSIHPSHNGILYSKGGADSIRYSVSGWGAYGLTDCSIYIHGGITRKQFLSGSRITSENYALRIDEGNDVVGFIGNADIDNLCLLPFARVRENVENGYRFIPRKQLPFPISRSESSIRETAYSIADSILYTLKAMTINSRELSGNDYNSFRDTVKSFHLLTENLTVSLSGHILIWSENPIIINSGCSLDNVIVFAPSIVVNGFRGNAQFISTDSISITGSKLLYPSSVILLSKNESASVKVETTDITGEFISLCTSKGASINVTVDEHSRITGTMTCDAAMDMRGELEGRLWARDLFYQTPAMSVSGVFVNPRIHRNKLPANYITNSLIHVNNPMGFICQLR